MLIIVESSLSIKLKKNIHSWTYFTFMWPCIVTNFFIIKPTGCTNFTNLFWHETLHVSDSSSVHHQEFILSWSCSKAVWHIPLLSVQWINSWTEELSETCSVSCQNKFVNLVHLIGFIIKKSWAYVWPIRTFTLFWCEYLALEVYPSI